MVSKYNISLIPSTVMVISPTIESNKMRVLNPGFILIINARLLFAPRVTSNSVRILATKSAAISLLISVKFSSSSSTISSNLNP